MQISCKTPLLLKIKSNFAHAKLIEILKDPKKKRKHSQDPLPKIKIKSSDLPPPFLRPEKILGL
jgi:hypothetical protein